VDPDRAGRICTILPDLDPDRDRHAGYGDRHLFQANLKVDKKKSSYRAKCTKLNQNRSIVLLKHLFQLLNV
jgi:hypothetical protein